VTDFIDLHASGSHWPAFNLADAAISFGAVLLVVDMLRARKQEDV
jgi:signal peptidase II